MSRDFLSNFESVEKPTDKSPADKVNVGVEDDSIEYGRDEYIRNLYLIWPDGKRHFMNYTRLDSGSIDAEQTTLRFFFGAETVELTGIRLMPLFNSISLHKRKYVYCDDPRYNYLDDDKAIVNEITIIEKK